MSRGGLTNSVNHRDYGATSSASTNAIHTIPDVNFSGFSPTEFMSLSENIAHNINSVRNSWQQLERALKVIGTKNDTQTLRDKVQHTQAQTNIKIQTTSKDLQRLAMVVPRGDKQQKLQVEKLTSDFRTIVEKYSTSQQDVVLKMRKTLLQPMLARQPDDDQAGVDRDQLIREQKQLQAGLQFEQDIALDREEQMRKIEENVLDVNAIMRELSTLAHQQGQAIDTIENSIDNACSDVEAGTSELMKAEQYRQRYRRKILILLIIAVIIGLVVTGIIVGQLKS